jgi:hypothetical protein
MRGAAGPAAGITSNRAATGLPGMRGAAPTRRRNNEQRGNGVAKERRYAPEASDRPDGRDGLRAMTKRWCATRRAARAGSQTRVHALTPLSSCGPTNLLF